MKSIWRQTLDELDRLRLADARQVEGHFAEMELLQHQYNQLLEQMIKLRTRYHALGLAKEQSDRDISVMRAEAAALLADLNKQQANQSKQLEVLRSGLRKAEEMNSLTSDAACALEIQLGKQQEQKRFLYELLQSSILEKSEKQADLARLNEYHGALWERKKRTQQEKAQSVRDLQSLTSKLASLRSRHYVLSQLLNRAEEVSKQSWVQLSVLSDNENMAVANASKLIASNSGLESAVTLKEEQLSQLKAALATKKMLLAQQAVKSLDLQHKVGKPANNTASASKRLSSAKQQLNAVKQEVADCNLTNTAEDCKNRQLAKQLEAYNSHILNLHSCANQLISAAEGSLGEDVHVRSVLFSKLQSFRSLKDRHQAILDPANQDQPEADLKFGASRSTQFSTNVYGTDT